MKKRLEDLNDEKLNLNDKIKDLEEELDDLKRLRESDEERGTQLKILIQLLNID